MEAQPSSSSTPSHPSLARRGDGHGRRRHWSPFHTMTWSSIEFAFVLGQIFVAALVVLTLSRHENPQTPLFAWVVGYATRCVACLPLLYWRYLHRNQDSSQSNSQAHQPNSFIRISFTPSSVEESTQPQNPPSVRVLNPRLIALVKLFKMALDCFFVVGLGFGNVWIFGGNASAADAPNLYRLCIVFLTLGFVEYAIPFIICTMIRCCLPSILSVLGVCGDMNQMRGVSEEYINALPKHRFQLKRSESSSTTDSSNSEIEEGGVVAAGTEKERAISAEDAVCCICLARYTHNDELRELPCSHFFHTDCVDQWLKINASCPLCSFDVETNEIPYQ